MSTACRILAAIWCNVQSACITPRATHFEQCNLASQLNRKLTRFRHKAYNLSDMVDSLFAQVCCINSDMHFAGRAACRRFTLASRTGRRREHLRLLKLVGLLAELTRHLRGGVERSRQALMHDPAQA